MMSRLQDVDVQHCPIVSAMLGTMIPTAQIMKSVIAISIVLDGPLSLNVEPEHGKEELPVPVARTSCTGRQLPFVLFDWSFENQWRSPIEISSVYLALIGGTQKEN